MSRPPGDRDVRTSIGGTPASTVWWGPRRPVRPEGALRCDRWPPVRDAAIPRGRHPSAATDGRAGELRQLPHM